MSDKLLTSVTMHAVSIGGRTPESVSDHTLICSTTLEFLRTNKPFNGRTYTELSNGDIEVRNTNGVHLSTYHVG
jgi:hypothetical protein